MAEEPESIIEWLDIDLERLTNEDKVNLIGEICDELPVLELHQVRDLAIEKAQDKLEDAKNMVIAEMRTKLSQLGYDFDEVMGTRRGRRTKSLEPKYRNPATKQTWSGRGMQPKWIVDHELAGGNREDFRIVEKVE